MRDKDNSRVMRNCKRVIGHFLSHSPFSNSIPNAFFRYMYVPDSTDTKKAFRSPAWLGVCSIQYGRASTGQGEFAFKSGVL
jgi:hypothetical protein